MTLCSVPSDWSIKRRVIFNNAKRLFALFGLSQITLEDIARGYRPEEQSPPPDGCSVSKAYVGMLYKKEDLLREILDSAWVGINGKIDQILARDMQAVDKLRSFLREIPLLLEEDLDAVGVLIRERYPSCRFDGSFCECSGAQRCRGKIEKLIAQVAKEEKLRLDAKRRRAMMHCLYGGMEHAMLDVYIQYTRHPDEPHIQRLLQAHQSIKALTDTLLDMADGFLRKS